MNPIFKRKFFTSRRLIQRILVFPCLLITCLSLEGVEFETSTEYFNSVGGKEGKKKKIFIQAYEDYETHHKNQNTKGESDALFNLYNACCNFFNSTESPKATKTQLNKAFTKLYSLNTKIGIRQIELLNLDKMESIPREIHFIWIGGEIHPTELNNIKIFKEINSSKYAGEYPYKTTLWVDKSNLLVNDLKHIFSEKVKNKIFREHDNSNSGEAIQKGQYKEDFFKYINEVILKSLTDIPKAATGRKNKRLTYDEKIIKYIGESYIANEDELADSAANQKARADLKNELTIRREKLISFYDELEKKGISVEDFNTNELFNDELGKSSKTIYRKEIAKFNLPGAGDIARMLILRNRGGIYLDVDLLPKIKDSIFSENILTDKFITEATKHNILPVRVERNKKDQYATYETAFQKFKILQIIKANPELFKPCDPIPMNFYRPYSHPIMEKSLKEYVSEAQQKNFNIEVFQPLGDLKVQPLFGMKLFGGPFPYKDTEGTEQLSNRSFNNNVILAQEGSRVLDRALSIMNRQYERINNADFDPEPLDTSGLDYGDHHELHEIGRLARVSSDIYDTPNPVLQAQNTLNLTGVSLINWAQKIVSFEERRIDRTFSRGFYKVDNQYLHPPQNNTDVEQLENAAEKLVSFIDITSATPTSEGSYFKKIPNFFEFKNNVLYNHNDAWYFGLVSHYKFVILTNLSTKEELINTYNKNAPTLIDPNSDSYKEHLAAWADANTMLIKYTGTYGHHKMDHKIDMYQNWVNKINEGEIPIFRQHGNDYEVHPVNYHNPENGKWVKVLHPLEKYPKQSTDDFDTYKTILVDPEGKINGQETILKDSITGQFFRKRNGIKTYYHVNETKEVVGGWYSAEIGVHGNEKQYIFKDLNGDDLIIANDEMRQAHIKAYFGSRKHYKQHLELPWNDLIPSAIEALQKGIAPIEWTAPDDTKTLLREVFIAGENQNERIKVIMPLEKGDGTTSSTQTYREVRPEGRRQARMINYDSNTKVFYHGSLDGGSREMVNEPEVNQFKSQTQQGLKKVVMTAELEGIANVYHDVGLAVKSLGASLKATLPHNWKKYKVLEDTIQFNFETGELSADFQAEGDSGNIRKITAQIDPDELKVPKYVKEQLEARARAARLKGMQRANRVLGAAGALRGLFSSMQALGSGNTFAGSVGLVQSLHGLGAASGLNEAILYSGVSRSLLNKVSKAVAGKLAARYTMRMGREMEQLALELTPKVTRVLTLAPVADLIFGPINIYLDLQNPDVVLGIIDATLDAIITIVSIVSVFQPELAPLVLVLVIIRMLDDDIYKGIKSELEHLRPDATLPEYLFAIEKGFAEGLKNFVVDFANLLDRVMPSFLPSPIKLYRLSTRPDHLNKTHLEHLKFLQKLADYSEYYATSSDWPHRIDFNAGEVSAYGGAITFRLGEPGKASTLRLGSIYDPQAMVFDDVNTLHSVSREIDNNGITDIVLGSGVSKKVTLEEQSVQYIVPLDSFTMISSMETVSNTMFGTYYGNSQNNNFYTLQKYPDNLQGKDLPVLSEYRYTIHGEGGNDNFILGPQKTVVEGGPGADHYLAGPQASPVLVIINEDLSGTSDSGPFPDLLSINVVWNDNANALMGFRPAENVSIHPDFDLEILEENITNDLVITYRDSLSNRLHSVYVKKWFNGAAYQHLDIFTQDGYLIEPLEITNSLAQSNSFQYYESSKVKPLLHTTISPRVEMRIRSINKSSETNGVTLDLNQARYRYVGEVIGTTGSDTLLGNANNNILNGNAGLTNTLQGNAGIDTYNISMHKGTNYVVINNFDTNQTADAIIFNGLVYEQTNHYQVAYSGDDLTFQMNDVSPAGLTTGRTVVTIKNWKKGKDYQHLACWSGDNYLFQFPTNETGSTQIETRAYNALHSPTGINISTNIATPIFNKMHKIMGSRFPDTLTGNSQDNLMHGGGAGTTFSTRDRIKGGEGQDTYLYFPHADGMVEIDVSSTDIDPDLIAFYGNYSNLIARQAYFLMGGEHVFLYDVQENWEEGKGYNGGIILKDFLRGRNNRNVLIRSKDGIIFMINDKNLEKIQIESPNAQDSNTANNVTFQPTKDRKSSGFEYNEELNAATYLDLHNGDLELLFFGTHHNAQGITTNLLTSGDPFASKLGKELSEINTIMLTPHPDHFTDTDDAHTIHGLSGDDIINASGGNDAVYGGYGTNTLDGGDGIDLVCYHDISLADGMIIQMDEGKAIKFPGTEAAIKTDYFKNFEGAMGSEGSDTIETSLNASDIIYGMGGDDHLYSMGGSDYLDGGLGKNYYYIDPHLSAFKEVVTINAVLTEGMTNNIIERIEFKDDNEHMGEDSTPEIHRNGFDLWIRHPNLLYRPVRLLNYYKNIEKHRNFDIFGLDTYKDKTFNIRLEGETITIDNNFETVTNSIFEIVNEEEKNLEKEMRNTKRLNAYFQLHNE